MPPAAGGEEWDLQRKAFLTTPKPSATLTAQGCPPSMLRRNLPTSSEPPPQKLALGGLFCGPFPSLCAPHSTEGSLI